MVSNKKRNIILISLAAIVLIFILFSVMCVVIYFLFSASENIEGKDRLPYQYLQVDNNLNETKYGFVRMTRSLKTHEYITYDQKTQGKTVFISRFGISDNQYRCHGSCSCKCESRRAANILSNGIFLLFTAATAALALKMSQDVFHNNCLQRTTCLQGCTVESTVDDCVVIDDEEVEEEEYSYDKEDILEWVNEKVVDTNEGLYFCYGHCVNIQERNICSDYLSDKIQQVKKDESVDCEGLNIEAMIEADNSAVVEQRFHDEFLSPFCHKNSLFKLWEKSMVKKDKDGNRNLFDAVCESRTIPEHVNIKCSKIGDSIGLTEKGGEK